MSNEVYLANHHNPDEEEMNYTVTRDTSLSEFHNLFPSVAQIWQNISFLLLVE